MPEVCGLVRFAIRLNGRGNIFGFFAGRDRMTWKRMTISKITEEIVTPLQRMSEQWAKLCSEVDQNGMPSVFTSFAKIHQDSLDKLSGCYRETVSQLDNQITSFRRNEPCLIEKNQERNSKAKMKLAPAKKKIAKKRS